MTFREIVQARAKKNVAVKAMKKFSPYEIILSPLFTEKSHKQQETDHKYSFKVHGDANKNDVVRAIEFIYKVTPTKINMENVEEKGRNNRKLVRKAYKKAIVTLNKKDKIELGI
jgi:large subunit ribosomal protein L23